MPYPGYPQGDVLRTSATLTGLEPVASAVTGRRANQLRYRAMLVMLSCFGACSVWTEQRTL